LQGLTVQGGDGSFQVLALGQLDETEASRLSRNFVANHHGRGGLKTGIADEPRKFIVCHFVGKVPHE
jgi:hypothetical protein